MLLVALYRGTLFHFCFNFSSTSTDSARLKVGGKIEIGGEREMEWMDVSARDGIGPIGRLEKS